MKNFELATNALKKVTDIITRNGVLTESVSKSPYVRVVIIKENVKVLMIDKNYNQTVVDITNHSEEELHTVIKTMKKIFL